MKFLWRTSVPDESIGGKSKINPGLCGSCIHSKIVPGKPGSIFYSCTLSKVDPNYPKYPPLPVLSCAGFQQAKIRDEQPE
jgi:hypothetical protein